MSRVRRLVVSVLALAMTATACGGGEVSSTTTDAVTPTSETSSTSSGADTTTSTPGTSSSTTSPSGPVGPPWIEGLPPLALLTPTSGAGERPVLEWEEVPGADRYEVFLFLDDGTAYWSWTGAETSVIVGGVELPDSAPGPRVAEGTSWAVLAVDADGLPVAVSERRPIAP